MEDIALETNDIRSSEGIGEIAGALSKAQMSYDKITRDAINPFFKSRYTTLDEIIRATRKSLAENGLVLMQFVTGSHELVTVVSRLIHTSGQWIESRISCRPAKADIQQIGVVSTYSKRYAMAAMLGVSADDDDDANAAVYISEGQCKTIEALLEGHDDIKNRMLKSFKAINKIPIAQYDVVVRVIEKTIEGKK